MDPKPASFDIFQVRNMIQEALRSFYGQVGQSIFHYSVLSWNPATSSAILQVDKESAQLRPRPHLYHSIAAHRHDFGQH